MFSRKWAGKMQKFRNAMQLDSGFQIPPGLYLRIELNPLDAGLDLASHKLEDTAKILSMKNTNEYNSNSVAMACISHDYVTFFLLSETHRITYSQLCRAQPGKFSMDHPINYDNSLTSKKSTKIKEDCNFLKKSFSLFI